MKRYIKLLLENIDLEKLNIDFILDILLSYTINDDDTINQTIKKYMILLKSKKFNRFTKEDKKILAIYIEKLFNSNVKLLVDDFVKFLSRLLYYIIIKENQTWEDIIYLILDCYSYLQAFNDWKSEFKFHPGRKYAKFHREAYYALEYIKNNYDELYKKALLEANLEIKDEYLNLISLNEILAHKNEYYFVHKYIYSKEAKDYYFKELDKYDI